VVNPDANNLGWPLYGENAKQQDAAYTGADVLGVQNSNFVLCKITTLSMA